MGAKLHFFFDMCKKNRTFAAKLTNFIKLHTYMKQFSLLFILLALLVGCNNTYNMDGAKLKTINVVVNAADWKYTQQGNGDQYNNNFFYASVDMPEISREVFDYGEVKAYLVYDRTSSYYARKHLLPYVLHVEELVDHQWLFYTQTIDFTYGIGRAEFNFRMSDFAYEENININPPAMDFDIVITYPQD